MEEQQQYWEDVSQYLQAIGIYSPQLVAALKEASSSGLDTYPFRKRVFQDQEVVDYSFNFNFDTSKGWILPDKYNASLRLTYPFAEQVLEGINIRDLDRRLQRHPWDREDALSALGHPKHVTLGELGKTIMQLKKLLYSENPEAKDIGERLAARYWIKTQMEIAVDLSQVVKRFERSYDFPLDPTMQIISIEKAHGLLLGGSVTSISDTLEKSWVYIDFSAPKDKALVYVQDLNLAELLKGAPLKELYTKESAIELVEGLMKGNKMPVTVEGEENEGRYLHVDAARRKLVLSDNSGNTISLDLLGNRKPAVWLKEKMGEIPSLPGQTPEHKRKSLGL